MPEEQEQPIEEVAPELEEERDPEVEARRRAALSFIRRLGDPVLKSSATPVDRFDDALRAQVARMGGLMNDALGVGLAAPQIGLSQRLLVYRVGQDAPLIALVNPEIEWRSSDETGAPRLVEASGLEARVIQHEIDHLDGVLILDRTSKEQRKEAMRQLREAEEQQEAA
jgi:peptide deformylase